MDTLVVDFDQAMNTNGADDEAILEDPDGTRCRLDDLNSAFVYSDDPDPDGDDDFTNERLTITLDAGTCEAGGAAGITQAGTVGGMQFPVEVIETDGIVDADDGFDWNLEDSPDTTFE